MRLWSLASCGSLPFDEIAFFTVFDITQPDVSPRGPLKTKLKILDNMVVRFTQVSKKSIVVMQPVTGAQGDLCSNVNACLS